MIPERERYHLEAVARLDAYPGGRIPLEVAKEHLREMFIEIVFNQWTQAHLQNFFLFPALAPELARCTPRPNSEGLVAYARFLAELASKGIAQDAVATAPGAEKTVSHKQIGRRVITNDRGIFGPAKTAGAKKAMTSALGEYQDDRLFLQMYERAVGRARAHPFFKAVQLVATCWDRLSPVPLRLFSRKAINALVNEMLIETGDAPVNDESFKKDVLGRRRGLGLVVASNPAVVQWSPECILLCKDECVAHQLQPSRLISLLQREGSAGTRPRVVRLV